jgi:hypothetical protein
MEYRNDDPLEWERFVDEVRTLKHIFYALSEKPKYNHHKDYTAIRVREESLYPAVPDSVRKDFVGETYFKARHTSRNMPVLTAKQLMKAVLGKEKRCLKHAHEIKAGYSHQTILTEYLNLKKRAGNWASNMKSIIRTYDELVKEGVEQNVEEVRRVKRGGPTDENGKHLPEIQHGVVLTDISGDADKEDDEMLPPA